MRLLSTAAQRACPDGAVDAMSRLLIRNWPSAAFRRAMGWESVKGISSVRSQIYGTPCQVRLADALCEDVAIAQDVLSVLSLTPNCSVTDGPTSQNTSLIGTAISFSPGSGIAGRPEQNRGGHGMHGCQSFRRALTAAQRAGGRKTPAVLVDYRCPQSVAVDSQVIGRRHAPPERMHAGTPSLRQFNPAEATSTVVRSAFDTFINVCTPSQLAALDADLRALLWPRKAGSEPPARLDGLIFAHVIFSPRTSRQTSERRVDYRRVHCNDRTSHRVAVSKPKPIWMLPRQTGSTRCWHLATSMSCECSRKPAESRRSHRASSRQRWGRCSRTPCKNQSSAMRIPDRRRTDEFAHPARKARRTRRRHRRRSGRKI